MADPVGERPAASAAEERQRPADETASAPGGVCPYRGLASYRREDARWFFGRERSTDTLVTQLGAVAGAGGLVMLVGASGAGKSSLLNAGLVPALRDGALGGDDGDGVGDGSGRARAVVQLVPGGDPLAELSRCIPELAPVVSASIPPGEAPPRPAAVGSDASLAERPGSATAPLAERPGSSAAGSTEPSPVERPGPSPTGEPTPSSAPAGDPTPQQPGGPATPESDAPRLTTAPPLTTPPSPEAVRAAVSAWARRTDPSGARPVVIVDQFEETFTLCPDEAERRTFIEVLHAACSPAGPGEPAPAVVVLGIRADFYDRCLRYPELADALQHRHMVLGPLTTTELREAVTGPAKAVGLELEPGLAELIVREVSTDGPRGAHDAGVLPLLSHALLATWQRRKAGGSPWPVTARPVASRARSRRPPNGPGPASTPPRAPPPACSCSAWSGWARTPRPRAAAAPGVSWRRSRPTRARPRSPSKRWSAPGW